MHCEVFIGAMHTMLHLTLLVIVEWPGNEWSEERTVDQWTIRSLAIPIRN